MRLLRHVLTENTNPQNDNKENQNEFSELQNLFFAQYDYNFWVYKGKTLVHFISNSENISQLKSQGDTTPEEIILQGLKMELHMTAFHCTECLFRIFYAMYETPGDPWKGMKETYSNDVNNFIRCIMKNGITKCIKKDGIISIDPDVKSWLLSNIYPTIQKGHERYERAKKSIDFIIDYLQLLARKYDEHPEYIAYKHGLQCFPIIQPLKASEGKQTGQSGLDKTNGVIQFLELGERDSEGRKAMIIEKTFSNIEDINIINTNSAILHNIQELKKLLRLTE
jgi:hypothetical protein